MLFTLDFQFQIKSDLIVYVRTKFIGQVFQLNFDLPMRNMEVKISVYLHKIGCTRS